MNELGIEQWDEFYPSKAILRDDIENGHMFVGCLDDAIISVPFHWPFIARWDMHMLATCFLGRVGFIALKSRLLFVIII